MNINLLKKENSRDSPFLYIVYTINIAGKANQSK